MKITKIATKTNTRWKKNKTKQNKIESNLTNVSSWNLNWNTLRNEKSHTHTNWKLKNTNKKKINNKWNEKKKNLQKKNK